MNGDAGKEGGDKHHRSARIRQIIAKCRERLAAGHDVPEESVSAKFPDLMPELGQELKKLRMIEEARRAAQPALGDGAPPPTEAHGADLREQPNTGDPGPGVRLTYFGDYELLEEIGRGGMGVVFKARQISLSRTVAVKMIISGQLASDEDIRRFQIEAESAANLEHPNIVPIYEIGDHEGNHYFSMAYVEGPSLDAMIRKHPLSSRDAAQYMRALSSGMAYAHEQGVLHRDLKPANVLIDANDKPRITDFGLAWRVQSDSNLTATGQVLGTPSYMPPEQAQGNHEGVGPQSDLYSLGAMLYTSVTGRPPFQADSTMATLFQVIEQEPVPPRLLNPSVDRDVETICLKCLEKDPTRRYATCDELVNELTRYLEGKPITARPISRPAKAWRWCKRNPVVAGLMGTVAAVLVLGVIVSSFFAVAASRNALIAATNEGLANQRAEEAEEERQRAEEEKERADAQSIVATKAAEQEKLARVRADEESGRAKAQEKLAQRRLYVSQIQLASHAWDSAKIGLMNDYLDATNSEYRHWEYGHLWWRLNKSHYTLRGHSGVVFGVAFSPDGQRIVSGNSNGVVTVWDASRREEIRSFNGHKGTVETVAFSSDGQRIASGGQFGDNMVKVWDAETGREIRTLKGHSDAIQSVAFSPDDRWIVSGSKDKMVKMWDAATGLETVTFRGHSDWVNSVAFSSDGQRIVSGGGDHMVKVWDAATAKETLTIKHPGYVQSVAFSPDGRRIVSSSAGARFGRAVKVWDAATGEEEATLGGGDDMILCVAFSPDGRQLIGGDWSGELKGWYSNGQEALTLRGHSGKVFSVAFSPDGQRIVSGGQDGVKLWDASRDQLATVTLHGTSNYFTSVAFSPDGRWIVSGGDKVRVWDAMTGQQKLTVDGSRTARSVAFSPDGQRIVSRSGDKGITWDTATGEQLLARL